MVASSHIHDMLIGYARVSTDDQNLRLQRAALTGDSCRRILEETLSAARRDRPERSTRDIAETLEAGSSPSATTPRCTGR